MNRINGLYKIHLWRKIKHALIFKASEVILFINFLIIQSFIIMFPRRLYWLFPLSEQGRVTFWSILPQCLNRFFDVLFCNICTACPVVEISVRVRVSGAFHVVKGSVFCKNMFLFYV